jgi:hypothetical protein
MDNSNFNPSGAAMPKINPFDYPDEVCENCGHNVFVPGVIFKKVPGVLVGAGTEEVSIPIKVAVCQKCGALSPDDKEAFEVANKAKSDKDKPASGLIL